jgi:hypothetical protein
MTTTQTITKLSPSESTAEVLAALTAAGLVGNVSSSPVELGRQRKMYLATVVSRTDADRALIVMRDLPDVCSAYVIDRSAAYIYRRLT